MPGPAGGRPARGDRARHEPAIGLLRRHEEEGEAGKRYRRVDGRVDVALQRLEKPGAPRQERGLLCDARQFERLA